MKHSTPIPNPTVSARFKLGSADQGVCKYLSISLQSPYGNRQAPSSVSRLLRPVNVRAPLRDGPRDR